MRPDRILFCLVVILMTIAIARDGIDRWIAETDMPVLLTETSVEMLDRDGQLLRLYTVDDGRWRLNTSIDGIDQTYLDMLIAYEDKRFYHHSGVDLWAVTRAVGQAAWHGRIVSGGSTLTMQVARLLEDSGTGRFKGKIRQIRVALALERQLTKQEILSLYLVRAPFGGNLEGTRAASLAWFGKEPVRLTHAEAALLVALPQSPEARKPDRYPDAARDARYRVLQRMVQKGVVNRDEMHAALSEPIPTARRAFPAFAPHLTDRAKAEDPARPRHHLTLDRDLQKKLEALSQDVLRRLPKDVSVALLVADHSNGEILASVGSASYGAGDARQGYVDMTRAIRSPGSTLKPLIYGMAFDRGLAHPQTLINDRPVSFENYAPQNFDSRFRGEVTISDALRQSLNIPVVLLMNEIGPAHLMAALRRSGTHPVLPGQQAGLAVALGGVGVTLTDLVQLYAMIAQHGHAKQLSWRQNSEQVNFHRVISRSAAWHVGNILSDVNPPAGAPRGQLAYKTGTSYGHRDAWAIGFDGTHVIGVWIGRPDGTPVPGAFGGDLAAPVLFEAFGRITSGPHPLAPPPPETLILTTAELPQPLRRFSGRHAVFEAPEDAPKLVFPRGGSRIPIEDGRLPVKLRDGKPPFTWLANGEPVLAEVHRRSAMVTGMTKGFSTLTVIDANGFADRVTVWID